MKKKLHKIGTTILLALAPAAALGITVGIIVNNLTTDVEKEVTANEWFKEYKIATDKFQSNLDLFSKNEVEVTVKGEKAKTTYVGQFSMNGYRYGYVDFGETVAGRSGCYLTDDPAVLFKERVTENTKYSITKKYLKVSIPNDSIENGHENIVFTRDGYIISYDRLNDWSYINYEVTYLTSPHEVTEYELLYDSWVQDVYSGPRSLLKSNIEYTYTINLDGTHPINYFSIIKFDGESISYEPVVLSNVKVTGVDESKWEMSSDNKSVKFKEQLTTGKIIVKCKLSLTSNGEFDYYPVASVE